MICFAEGFFWASVIQIFLQERAALKEGHAQFEELVLTRQSGHLEDFFLKEEGCF